MDDDLGGVGADLSTFERGVAGPEELQRTARKREHIRARAHVRDLPAVARGVDRERIDRAGGQRSGVSPGQRAAVTERGVVGRRAVAIGSQDSGGRAVKAHHVASADLTHADYAGCILHQSPAKDVIGAAARGSSRDGARGSGLIEEHRSARGTRNRAAKRERAARANGHRVGGAGGDGEVADVLITGSEGERAAAEGGARGRAERTARDAQRAARDTRGSGVVSCGARKRPGAVARLGEATSTGLNRARQGAVTRARQREPEARSGDGGGAGKSERAGGGGNRRIGAKRDGAGVSIGTEHIDQRTGHARRGTSTTDGQRPGTEVVRPSQRQYERAIGGDRNGGASADRGSVLKIQHAFRDGGSASVGIGTSKGKRPIARLRQPARSAHANRILEGDLIAVGVESRTASPDGDRARRRVRAGVSGVGRELQTASIDADRSTTSQVSDVTDVDETTVDRRRSRETARARQR